MWKQKADDMKDKWIVQIPGYQNFLIYGDVVMLLIALLLHRFSDIIWGSVDMEQGKALLSAVFTGIYLVNIIVFDRYCMKLLLLLILGGRGEVERSTLKYCTLIILFITETGLAILSPLFKVQYWEFAVYGLIICLIFTVAEWCLTSEQSKKTALSGYRKDTKYIPELLEQIKDSCIKNRIAHELYTYAYKARWYKKLYYLLNVISLVASAFTVAVNSLESTLLDEWRLLLTIISVLTAAVSGIMNAVKVKETWIRNREYCERVKSEIYKYVIGIQNEKSSGKGNEKDLAESLENIFMEENGRWKETRTKG